MGQVPTHLGSNRLAPPPCARFTGTPACMLVTMMEAILLYGGALVVGILSVARLTRLVTQDSFPPAVKFRMWWDRVTDDGEWSTLMHCHWCITPWLVIPIGLWAWLSDLHVSWWVFNGWLALAYVSAMVVERDEVVQ